MLIIKSFNTEPYFNLAAEEHLLKNFDEDIFRLWQNDNAVVVGKHQNTLAEVNMEFARENNVKVVRRISGGGTVFHDMGNLNFTFIRNAKKDEDTKIDFRQFTQPVIDVLQSLGVNAEHSGRNDLLIDGLKFSGNAEHVHQQKKRTLHHGTMLFNSKLENLGGALRVDPLKYTDKAVKSVRSKVTNIASHLKNPLNLQEFTELVEKHIISINSNAQLYEFSQSDIETINELAETKYKTWEWNFGYSPDYRLHKAFDLASGKAEMNLFVQKGRIISIDINSSESDISELIRASKSLEDCKHEPGEVEKLLDKTTLIPSDKAALLKALF